MKRCACVCSLLIHSLFVSFELFRKNFTNKTNRRYFVLLFCFLVSSSSLRNLYHLAVEKSHLNHVSSTSRHQSVSLLFESTFYVSCAHFTFHFSIKISIRWMFFFFNEISQVEFDIKMTTMILN